MVRIVAVFFSKCAQQFVYFEVENIKIGTVAGARNEYRSLLLHRQKPGWLCAKELHCHCQNRACEGRQKC